MYKHIDIHLILLHAVILVITKRRTDAHMYVSYIHIYTHTQTPTAIKPVLMMSGASECLILLSYVSLHAQGPFSVIMTGPRQVMSLLIHMSCPCSTCGSACHCMCLYALCVWGREGAWERGN